MVVRYERGRVIRWREGDFRAITAPLRRS